MDREADVTVTVSEIDRLHSQLSRLEGMFPGYRTEIVEGAIVMGPVEPHHAKTIRAVWNALEVVETGIGRLAPDTGELPVDPAARA
jgi:hypothetical protein